MMDNKISYEFLVQIEREACLNSFYEFVKSFWSVVIKEKPVYNWHIKFICDELQTLSECIFNRTQKPYDLIINIPPSTTKSTICSVMFPAWLWAKDDTIRILSNSFARDLSTDLAVKSKDIIGSQKYKTLFPNVKLRNDKKAKIFYETTNGGSRTATSMNSGSTGKHAHVVIDDDPLGAKQGDSPALRKQALEKESELATRTVNPENCPHILIMQRLHQEDPTGQRISSRKGTVRHLCLPATDNGLIYPPELRENYIDGLLDPVRLNRKVLADRKIELGERGYSCQYDQNPVPEGGNYIQQKWFTNIPFAEFMKIRSREPIDFFIDSASTKNTNNDPTGILACCTIKNTLYIVKTDSVYMEFPDLLKFIQKFVDKTYGSSRSRVFIEPKNNGHAILQQLKLSTSLNMIGIDGKVVSDGKEVRLESISPIVESGRVVLVDGVWNEPFVTQVCGYPALVHDEYVDLLSYSVIYHQKDHKRRKIVIRR